MQAEVKPEELPLSVRDFMAYKLTIQGCSPKTVNEYACDLRTFFRYISAKRNGYDVASMSDKEFTSIDISGIGLDFVESVTTAEIYDFLYYTLTGRMNQWSARARKLSALKSYYKYLTVSIKATNVNPVKDIEGPKPKKSLPKHLTLEESIRLLDTIASDTESKTRERDYCIVTLFLNCGIRLSELVGINLGDIDRNMESLRVTGKGSKERLIYLNDACRNALNAYLPVRSLTEIDEKHKNALFITRLRRRISNQMIQATVHKYLELAGLGNRNFSTHKLRHTAATLMYQTGKVDVRVLKDILGHEQLNTTQIYTHISDESMKQAMADNPLSEINKKNED